MIIHRMSGFIHRSSPRSVADLIAECESMWAGETAFHNNKTLAGIYYDDSWKQYLMRIYV